MHDYVNCSKVFDQHKAITGEQLTQIHSGLQLARYFFEYQRREEARMLSVMEVVVKENKIDSIQCSLNSKSQGWSFELRKKGDHWLPCEFEMSHIE